MGKKKIAVLVLCLGCWQFGCGKSDETGASESQAKKVPQSARLRQKLEKDVVLTLIKERGLVSPKGFINMPSLAFVSEGAQNETEWNSRQSMRASYGWTESAADSALWREWYRAGHKVNALNLELYRRLVSAGWLTDRPCTASPQPEFKHYCFGPKTSNADLMLGRQYGNNDPDLQLARTQVQSFDVVNIEQESGQAKADVVFRWEYTGVWRAVQAVCAQLQPELLRVKQTDINTAHLFVNGQPNGMVRPGTGLIHCTDPMAQGAAQALPSSGQSFYLKYFRKVVEGDIEGWYLVDQYGRRQ